MRLSFFMGILLKRLEINNKPRKILLVSNMTFYILQIKIFFVDQNIIVHHVNVDRNHLKLYRLSQFLFKKCFKKYQNYRFLLFIKTFEILMKNVPVNPHNFVILLFMKRDLMRLMNINMIFFVIKFFCEAYLLQDKWTVIKLLKIQRVH
jgi:hypothetical protein